MKKFLVVGLTVEDIMAPAHVHRWHMIRVSRTQTLSEHSFNVAMLAAKFNTLLSSGSCEDIGDLLMGALTHDYPEIEYGDIPTPSRKYIKANHPEVIPGMEQKFWESRGMSEEVWGDKGGMSERLIKLADRADAFMFYVREGDDPRITNRLRGEMLDRLEEFKDHPRLVSCVVSISNMRKGDL